MQFKLIFVHKYKYKYKYKHCLQVVLSVETQELYRKILSGSDDVYYYVDDFDDDDNDEDDQVYHDYNSSLLIKMKMLSWVSLTFDEIDGVHGHWC